MAALDQIDKQPRCEQAMHRMLPTHQRLHPFQAAIGQVDLGLKVGDELMLTQCPLHIRFSQLGPERAGRGKLLGLHGLYRETAQAGGQLLMADGFLQHTKQVQTQATPHALDHIEQHALACTGHHHRVIQLQARHLVQHLHTVHTGHFQIEHDNLDLRVGFHLGYRVEAIHRLEDVLNAHFTAQLSGKLALQFAVINHQHMLGKSVDCLFHLLPPAHQDVWDVIQRDHLIHTTQFDCLFRHAEHHTTGFILGIGFGP